jgi:flagellar biosynthesis component FlhA
MSIRKMKYVIKSCAADDTQELQNLLNEMSMNGWELYSMNEVENDEKIMFNCIFMMEDDSSKIDESDDIMSWGTVKNPIEKMLSPVMTPYEKGLEVISKIKAQKKKIAEIKEALDGEDASSGKRKKYNDKISSSIKEFEDLKKELVKMTNPSEMYQRLGNNAIELILSEELVPIADTDSEETENLYPEIIKMRYDNADNLGYVIPAIKMLDSVGLAPYEFEINVRGAGVLKSFAYPHHKMFFVEDLNLTRKMKGAIYDVDFITGRKIVWIDEDKTKDFWTNGLKAAQFITRALNFVSIKYVDEILGYDELERYCSYVEAENPFLVENIIPEVVSYADLRYILTSLLR